MWRGVVPATSTAPLSSPPSKPAQRLPAQSLVLSDLGAPGADLSTPESPSGVGTHRSL